VAHRSRNCPDRHHRSGGRPVPAAAAQLAARVLDQLDSGDFSAYLKDHAAHDYAALDEARRAALKRPLNVAHAQVRAAFRFPTEAAGGLYQAAPAGAEPELAR
ncbi:ketol-acid reductoisomerase, partial [Burkholderia thailandensis]|nr:ketol-acid reductoisomerase [Burkholderia thailandensis]